MPDNNPISTRRTDKGQGIDKHRDELNAWANEVNALLAGTAGAENVDFAANFLLLNSDYALPVAQTGGVAVSYLPTATKTTTVGYGVFTPGVDGVSDPTVTTLGAATFALNDLILVLGTANDGENDGLYEVVSHAANLLTLRSTDAGVTDRAEAFTRDQLVANAGDVGATIVKVNIAVLRAGTDGLFEVGKGSTTPLTFVDIPTAAEVAANAADIVTNADAGSVPVWHYEGVNQPTDGDILTIGADVYEFVDTGVNTVINDDTRIGVVIGGNAAATLVNLAAAVNGAGTAGAAVTLADTVTPCLEDGTENVTASIAGTELVCEYADAPGGTPTPGNPSIVLAESVTDAACIWVEGNVNVNTLGGRAAGGRAYSRQTQTVSAAMITKTRMVFRFPFTPVGFNIMVRSAAGRPRFGSAAAAADGCTDTFAISGKDVVVTLGATPVTDIVATDVVTVEAWAA